MAKIRIIDDDPGYIADLEELLTANGHEVQSLDTCEGAIEVLQNDTPDLLILDVMFPENAVAGFDFARKIRRVPELANLPILLFTAVNEEFPMGFSAADIDPDWMPVQDFIDKSSPLPQVLEKINALLAAD